LGGLDLAATLAAGRPVRSAGLLEEAAGRTLVLPMAERMAAGLAARLNAARDRGADFILILLDEGAEPGEAAPAALADRLAFRVGLDAVAMADLEAEAYGDVAAARARLGSVAAPEDLARAMVTVAAALGIGSLRAPMLALRAARAAAALAGDAVVDDDAAALAVRLVLAPRATRLPEVPEEDAEEPERETPPEPEAGEDRAESREIPDDVLLEAARAAVPPDLLARLLAGAAFRSPGAKGGGAGDERKSKARGRPAGSMRGDPRGGARIDLIGTLRAAAPWQPLRRRMGDGADRVLVQADDFRIKRSKRKAEKVVIFVVDASGSAAFARLAETKGAIELMLGQAYVARRQVALVAFRGDAAEVLLPPTRSLVMTKRRLAALAGGGGTPLASGLAAAMGLADQARSRGVAPYLAVLTDGRCNVAMDGTPGRPQAEADARQVARALRVSETRALVIDTGNRPSAPAREIAEAMGAVYLPLPRADARALSGALGAAMEGAA
jgi:magnesium chelatase subunit D